MYRRKHGREHLRLTHRPSCGEIRRRLQTGAVESSPRTEDDTGKVLLTTQVHKDIQPSGK